MLRSRFSLLTLLTCAGLLLAGCKSDEEKAAEFYQSGLALYEEGEPERALVQLRNVFDHDGFHKEARETYAGILIELGRRQEAYSQYLRLVEQYPDTVDVRVTLAEMAITGNDWTEAERHGKAAQELAPDRADVQALGIVLDYRDASVARDTEAQARVAGEAADLLDQIRAEDDEADNSALARIVIDHMMRGDTPTDALPALEAALQRDPEARDLNILKARLLAMRGDAEATGEQLKKMVELYPEDRDSQQTLINWYLSQNDIDGAEAFLRRLAGDADGSTDLHVSVVQFLAAMRGGPAAREEVSRLITANEGTAKAAFYRSLLAQMDFDAGEKDAAIAQMRTILEEAGTGEQTVRIKTMLARMLVETDDVAAADTVIAEVLEEDAGNVAALKMRAARLIDQDQSGEAVVALRNALNQAPQDADILTLMALAHERDGDTELMGERLALAVDVTSSAPPQALRYARFLVDQGRSPAAVNVLEDARRTAPQNLQVLQFLADLHVGSRNWGQARSIARALEGIDTADAIQAATELRARILQEQGRTDEGIAILESQIGTDMNADEAEIARTTQVIVQTQIRSDNPEAARATLDRALEKQPDNLDLQLLDANLLALMGETEAAEAGFRDLIDQLPQHELPVRLLVNLLKTAGQRDEADKVLEAALDRMPDQSDLLFLKAGRLEQAGDPEGAIAIYEDLYERFSGSVVVANNLASLLSSARDDDASLERAAMIARRLRGTNNPAFQDTYGWIASRRGDREEALSYLEPAARALSGDPLVQYHLGMTYAGLGRTEEARTALDAALKLAGDSPLPQFETARQTLADLDAAPASSDQ